MFLLGFYKIRLGMIAQSHHGLQQKHVEFVHLVDAVPQKFFLFIQIVMLSLFKGVNRLQNLNPNSPKRCPR